MSIKRYTLDKVVNQLFEAPSHGRWVRFTDHVAALAKVTNPPPENCMEKPANFDIVCQRVNADPLLASLLYDLALLPEMSMHDEVKWDRTNAVVSNVMEIRRQANRQANTTEFGQAFGDVLAERQRHVTGEGWSVEHDDGHDAGEMAAAGAAYALAAGDKLHPMSAGDGDFGPGKPPVMWPWAPNWWKPATPYRMLEKAASLIVAEMEKILRAEAKEKANG